MNELLKYLQKQLAAEYTNGEISILNNIIIRKIASIELTTILQKEEFRLTDKQFDKFKRIVARLQKHEPIQYILREGNFYGMDFFVNKNVMIPRPETEELVEWVLHDNKSGSVLDIGTGSGCIAITLAKKRPELQVWALDSSSQAISVAHKNAKLFKVNIHFLKQDILQIPHFKQKWDIIVSNPPYIPTKEQKMLHKSVKDFEPHSALFVADDTPVIFYEKIIQFAKNQLSTNGKIYFEIHKDFGNEIKKLLKTNGFKNIILKKDISGHDRMVYGEMNY